MIFGSCHFLCHQFIQRDEPNKVIADMNALTALSAAFIRSPDIDCLSQTQKSHECELRVFHASEELTFFET